MMPTFLSIWDAFKSALAAPAVSCRYRRTVPVCGAVFATLLLISSAHVNAQAVKYGAGMLVPSKGGAAPVQTAIIFHVTSTGNTVLGPSGKFVPVPGEFSVEGPFTSGILRGDSITPVKERAMLEGWTRVKRGESVIGWALKLGSGQIVVPVNREFLELALAGANAEAPLRSPSDRYPVDGRLRANLTRFTDYGGAVLEMGAGLGIYVMELDGDTGYVTLADDPHFTIIDTTPALRGESRKLLGVPDSEVSSPVPVGGATESTETAPTSSRGTYVIAIVAAAAVVGLGITVWANYVRKRPRT